MDALFRLEQVASAPGVEDVVSALADLEFVLETKDNCAGDGAT